MTSSRFAILGSTLVFGLGCGSLTVLDEPGPLPLGHEGPTRPPASSAQDAAEPATNPSGTPGRDTASGGAGVLPVPGDVAAGPAPAATTGSVRDIREMDAGRSEPEAIDAGSVRPSDEALEFIRTLTCSSEVGGCSMLQPALLVPPEAGGGFGAALALQGDRAFVGAPQHGAAGAVFVYRRARNAWRLVQTLEEPALTPDETEAFGAAVSAWEDRLLIGAPRAGKAYFYRREGEVWSLEHTFAALDTFGSVGRAVALLGDTALIAAPFFSGGNNGGGLVYVYRRRETGESPLWGFEHVFESGSAQSPGGGYNSPWMNAQLGNALALGPDIAVLGAPLFRRHGAAFIHQRDGDAWPQVAQFVAGEGEHAFGATVALAAGRAAVKHLGPRSQSEGVELYELSGETWSATEHLPSDGMEVERGFGDAIALDDDTLWIGAPDAAGVLYGYRRIAGAWVNVVRVEPGRGAVSFGQQLALHGGVLLASASPDVVVSLNWIARDVAADGGTAGPGDDAGSDGEGLLR